MIGTHSEFILKPLSKILFEFADIANPLNFGIEEHPLWDYLFMSLFLRLTGAQEQKCKCIAWELATINYEIRRKLFSSGNDLNCSTLKEKNTVFKYQVIGLQDFGVNVDAAFLDDVRLESYDTAFAKVNIFFEHVESSGLHPRECEFSKDLFCKWNACKGAGVDKIFGKCDSCKEKRNCDARSLKAEKESGLEAIYSRLYLHRNRCAHNVSSYQPNLPDLNKLVSPIYIYENYYTWFMVIMFIDELFINLYKEFEITLTSQYTI